MGKRRSAQLFPTINATGRSGFFYGAAGHCTLFPHLPKDCTDALCIYVHYYYNIDKATEEEKVLDRRLIALKSELESGKRVPEHETSYRRLFEIATTPKRGVKVAVKADTVAKAKRYFGFFGTKP